MVQSNSVSIFINSQFPDFINRYGSELVGFVESYYEWLAQYENPIFVARKLSEYKDVDLIPDKYLRFLRSEFMKSIPVTLVDDRMLMKNILDFYRARGTEKSYRMLFRILYGDDTVSFYYPGRDILRASDGKWIIERSLKLIITHGYNIEGLIIFRGGTSNATARRDRYLSYVLNEVEIQELYYNNVIGTFVAGEILIDENSGQEIGYVVENVTHPGGWIGTDGFLSSNKYLQDNNFYQEYSYQIRSSRSLVDYKQVAYNLVHPTGTRLFGLVDINSDIKLSDYLSIGTISTVSSIGDTPRVSISYEIVVPTSFSMTENVGRSAPIVGGTAASKKFDTLAKIANFKIADIGDIPINDFSEVIFLQKTTGSFSFPDWTPIKVNSTFFYARNVVNTSLLVLSSAYPGGEFTGLSYSYYA